MTQYGQFFVDAIFLGGLNQFVLWAFEAPIDFPIREFVRKLGGRFGKGMKSTIPCFRCLAPGPSFNDQMKSIDSGTGVSPVKTAGTALPPVFRSNLDHEILHPKQKTHQHFR